MTISNKLLIASTLTLVSLFVQAQILPANEEVFAHPVESQLLRGSRGGSALARTDVVLMGVTAGNTARDVTTGSNTISAGAFANMTGMPLVIQNSGANVLIQNSTVLNLRVN